MALASTRRRHWFDAGFDTVRHKFIRPHLTIFESHIELHEFMRRCFHLPRAAQAVLCHRVGEALGSQSAGGGTLIGVCTSQRDRGAPSAGCWEVPRTRLDFHSHAMGRTRHTCLGVRLESGPRNAHCAHRSNFSPNSVDVGDFGQVWLARCRPRFCVFGCFLREFNVQLWPISSRFLAEFGRNRPIHCGRCAGLQGSSPNRRSRLASGGSGPTRDLQHRSPRHTLKTLLNRWA